MAAFLADENFEDEVANALVTFGHDVVAARSVGLASTSDIDVLAAATAAGRCVPTHDRDYARLHKSGVGHAGIVFASSDPDFPALAARIDAAVAALPSLAGVLIRVTRPHAP